MPELKVLNLRRIVEAGILLGRVCYEKERQVTGEEGIIRQLQRLSEAIFEQRLDDEVYSRVYAAANRLQKKFGSGAASLQNGEEQELKGDARVWMELLLKSVGARIAFEPTKPISLNTESLMKAATNYSNPFIDDSVWRKLTKVARNDFQEAARCFIATSWTAAAMVTLRGVESVLRQYYEFRTQMKSTGKGWSEIIGELEARPDISKSLLGYVDFIRERRNETQHPEKTYSQRESENIFSVAVNAVTEMYREMPDVPSEPRA
nr:hypothetical protein [Candidatus Njordarchaeum guaymaensis]